MTLNQTPLKTPYHPIQTPQLSTLKNIAQFTFGDKIGEGTFGIVRKATHILTGESVAIKILDKTKLKTPTDKTRLEREISILKHLHHPNIINLYQVINTNYTIYLIQEYVCGKELLSHIISKRKLNESEACKYFQQIISGIEYMHRMCVAHRDIKPENILITFTKEIKIVDFGLSNTYKKGTFLSTACGSPCYAAPEMLEGKKYRGLSVDIWSCGTVLYMMLTGKLPFEDDDKVQLYKKIITGQYVLPEFLSRNAKDLIRKMLQTNPCKRITLNDIKSHSWFNIVSTVNNVYSGINVNTHVLPVDDDIVNKMEKYDYDKNEVKRNVILNEHNNVTTTYYLLLKKKVRQGIASVSDCKSEMFEEYVSNENNLLRKYKGGLNEVIKEIVPLTVVNDNGRECITVNERSCSKQPKRKYRNKSAWERNGIIKVSSCKYKQECLHKQMFTYFTQRLSRVNNNNNNDNSVMITSIRTPKVRNTRNINTNTSNNKCNNTNNNNNTFTYSHFNSFKTDDTIKKSICSPIHKQRNNKHYMTIQIKNNHKQFPQCKLTKNIYKVNESRNNTINNNITNTTEYKYLNKTKHTTLLHSQPKSISVENKIKHNYKLHNRKDNKIFNIIDNIKNKKVCSASKERNDRNNYKRSNILNKVNSTKNVYNHKHPTETNNNNNNEIQSPIPIEGLFPTPLSTMITTITSILTTNKIKYTYDKKHHTFKCDKLQPNNNSLHFDISLHSLPHPINTCYITFYKHRGSTFDYIHLLNLIYSNIN